MTETTTLLREGLLAALLATAMVIDCRTWRIPNWLTFGGALAGLGFSFAPGHGPDFLHALGGLALGLAALLPLRALGVLGAGDVKLMAMAGAFLGAPQVLMAILFSFIAGGAVAIGFAIRQRVFTRMLSNVHETVLAGAFALAAGQRPGVGAVASVGRVPYGIGICAGTLAWVAFTHFV